MAGETEPSPQPSAGEGRIGDFSSGGDLDLNPEAGWLWGHTLICLWEPSASLVWASHAQAVGVFSGRGGLQPSTSSANWAGL